MFAALALGVGLGRAPLFDPDQLVYAQAGREMLARGNWLVPWFGGFAEVPATIWALIWAALVIVLGALGAFGG